MSKFKEKKTSGMRLQEALELPICKGIPERGITERTCQRFGIRQEFSQVEGTVVAHLFPVTKQGKIVGFKRRELGISKKNAFSCIGDVTTECDLLGSSVKGQGSKLFIAEGVYDYLSLYESLYNAPQNLKRDQPFEPSVASITLGCGQNGENAAQSIASNKSYLDNFKEVILAFDNDDAGRDGVRAAALAYPDVRVAELELKDCNEYRVAKKDQALRDALFNPVSYDVEQIYYGAYDIDKIIQPIPPGVKIQAFPVLMQKLNGLRPAELTVILAPPKSGKTTIAKTLNYHLLLHKQKTLGIYLEEDLRKTHQSFIAMDNNVHLPTFRENPGLVSRENILTSMEKILNPEWAMFCDDGKGHLTPQKLMDMLEWSALKGCRYAILDHISFVFSGMKATDERKEIDKLMTDLAAFVKRTGMHVICVAHITRDKGKPKPKNQDGSVKYPYWYEVEEQDGRGSGAFEQICWNMIAIDREVTEDRSRGRTRLKVLYNREYDRTGICDELTLNQSTGKLEAVQAI